MYFKLYDYVTWKSLESCLPRSGLILDAAGGTGRWGRKIANNKRPAIICDISQNMLREGIRRRGSHSSSKHIFAVRASVDSLPFRRKAFRFLICERAFFTFSNSEGPIREFMRILLKGALLNLVAEHIR